MNLDRGQQIFLKVKRPSKDSPGYAITIKTIRRGERIEVVGRGESYAEARESALSLLDAAHARVDSGGGQLRLFE